MAGIKDLFVSYTRVDKPLKASIQENPFKLESPILSFLSQIPRAKLAVSSATVSTQTLQGWQGWRSSGVSLSQLSPVLPEPSSTTNPTISQQQVQSGTPEPEHLSSSTPTKLSGDKKAWKEQMLQLYKNAGCSDQFARNLVGQDANETGWGQKVVGDFNFGNIKTGKSWTGRSRKAHDKREGSYDAYRSYDSAELYVLDKLRLLRSRYKMTGNESPELFADKLVAGGYATSKLYKQHILSVIKSV